VAATHASGQQEDIDSTFTTISGFMKSKGVPFSGVVNNAGIVGRRPLEAHDISDVRHIMEVCCCRHGSTG
jgi:short-subunit dehydrogenase